MKSLFKTLFNGAILFLTFQIQAQIPELQWNKTLEGSGTNYVSDIEIDQDGNLYMVGYFTGAVDFDPSSSVNSLTVPYPSAYILKLDSNGAFLWVKTFNSFYVDNYTYSYSTISKILIDSSGDLVVYGSFGGKVDFDPSNATHEFLTYSSGFYVTKLDDNGNFIWAGYGDDVDPIFGTSCTIDASKNIYVTGKNFIGGSLLFGSYSSLYTGGSFLLKISPNGNLLWDKSIASMFSVAITDVVVNSANEILLVGDFSNSMDVDLGSGVHNLTPNGSSDGFISKSTANGDLIWAKQIGSVGSITDLKFVVDNNNDFVVYGSFTDTIDVNPDSGVENLISRGKKDGFILKLDDMGNLLWVKSMGGLENDFIVNVDIDVNNYIYAVGSFQETANFDISTIGYAMISTGGFDGFIEKLDPYGNIKWLQQTESSNDFPCSAVTVLDSLNILVGAYHDSAAILNFGIGNNSITLSGTKNGVFFKIKNEDVAINPITNGLIGPSGNGLGYQWIDCNNGSSDIFGETNREYFPTQSGNYGLKLFYGNSIYFSECVSFTITGIDDPTNESISIYPNPTTEQIVLTVNHLGSQEIEIYSTSGVLVYKASLTHHESHINLRGFNSGIYYVKVITPNEVDVISFVKE